MCILHKAMAPKLNNEEGKGDEGMSEHHQDGDDDELTRRFKAVFNKEPVSRRQTETEWRVQGQDDYEIDDDEVRCF